MVPILNISSVFNRSFNKLKTLLSATEAISFQLNFLNRIILFFRNLEHCKIEPVWRNSTQIPLHNHQWKKNQNQFSTFLPRSRKTDYKSQSFSLPFLLRTDGKNEDSFLTFIVWAKCWTSHWWWYFKLACLI